jgi:hypothetical protein
VQAEATRFGPGGPRAPKNVKADPSWEHVTWGLCAVAAVLIGEDYAPLLAKARTAASIAHIPWQWKQVNQWGGMPRLPLKQNKTLDALISELDSIMVELRAGRNASVFERIAGDQYGVFLLRGKNAEGDTIYAYVRVTLQNARRFKAAVTQGKFNPLQFGVVIAAGKGEPSVDVARDVALRISLQPTGTDEDAPVDPYLGAVSRGAQLVREWRYEEAVMHLKTASESKQAVADDHTQLGRCYGRLSRWNEAFAAHKKAVELEAKQTTGTDATLGLLEAFLLSERPEKVGPFIADLMAKKWQPREEKTTRRIQASALFYGFQAIAQRMLGQEATDLEKQMRQYTSQTRMENMDWRWDELDAWLKGTKLAPERKAAVEKIVAELKGLAAPAPK